jgi:hypothetical protein
MQQRIKRESRENQRQNHNRCPSSHQSNQSNWHRQEWRFSQGRNSLDTTVCAEQCEWCSLFIPIANTFWTGVELPQRYIAIKGTVFDVTHNEGAYGPGSKYNALVGRDASRALGKSSLKEEDTDVAVSHDISGFTERQLQVLDDWYSFFSQR